MTTDFARDDSNLQDAFYALSLAKPTPDAEVLDKLVRCYPEFAAELTDMAIDLVLDALCDEEVAEVNSGSSNTDLMVLRAMSRFQNHLHTVKTEKRASTTMPQLPPTNPFSTLSTADIRALGQRLHANTVFILKLRDRVIREDTLTPAFKRRIADELKAPLDVVVAHFAGQSSIGTQAHYKAAQKPEASDKQTFEDALRSSGLTDEQQKSLLSL